MKQEVLVGKVIPAVIFLLLWLDGWLLPLVLVPISYVIIIEKKTFRWLGFSKHNLWESLRLGLMVTVLLIGTYYPIFLHYLPFMLEKEAINIQNIFSDLFHYPIYEEIAYRSFILSHFADKSKTALTTQNLLINVIQSLFFLSIHKHHLDTPLVLLPVFLLAFLNGVIFLRTRNICGCLISHSMLNGFALLIRELQFYK